MSKAGFPLPLVLLPLLAAPTAAQEQPASVLSVYYVCDQTREARADTIVRTAIAPIVERQRRAGRLGGWGWLAHSAGPEWRRAAYYVAPSRDLQFEARDAILADVQAEAPEAAEEFNRICPSHVDYFWYAAESSQGIGAELEQRPAASISTYFLCDVAVEHQADEIVRLPLGTALNEGVERGEIASWSWLAHDTGGKFRRLLVLDGARHAELMNARDRILARFRERTPVASRTFSEACGLHDDYLWNVVIARP